MLCVDDRQWPPLSSFAAGVKVVAKPIATNQQESVMATQNKLTNTQIRNFKPDQANPKKRFISDGNGLYLSVTKRGSKSWIFRYRVGRKQTDVGLGGYPSISLAEARKRAAKCRVAKALGDVMKPPVQMTFKSVIERHVSDVSAQGTDLSLG
jgi:hypothetical protein